MSLSISERVKAYELMLNLKEKGLSKEDVIQRVVYDVGIPSQTVYHWYQYDLSPFGNRKIQFNSSFFYVIGALLGDGCAYYWEKGGRYMVHIVGEKEFMEKFSRKLEMCTGKKIKEYIDRSKGVWNLKTWNYELFMLLKRFRGDVNLLLDILSGGDEYNNSLQFIEGYFDAEGCVKIIKESSRKTPKICLDICSTDYNVLELIRELWMKYLMIEARYSIQVPKKSWKSNNKKTVYHLRIYRKDYIRKFFDNFHTIKLKPEKVEYVDNWLNNGK